MYLWSSSLGVRKGFDVGRKVIRDVEELGRVYSRLKPFKVFRPGDLVRLTGAFLANTRQLSTGEERKMVWTVVECHCALCRKREYVAVNEQSAFDPTQNRHIHVQHLYRAGTCDNTNAP